MTTHSYPEVKRVGETGQVSVGKSLAGRLVRVEPTQEGVFLRFVVDVAEKDAWWTQEPHRSQLQEALAWAAKNPATDSDLGELLARARVAAGRAPRAVQAGDKRPSRRRKAKKS